MKTSATRRIALAGMQASFRQRPPVLPFSTTAVFRPELRGPDRGDVAARARSRSRCSRSGPQAWRDEVILAPAGPQRTRPLHGPAASLYSLAVGGEIDEAGTCDCCLRPALALTCALPAHAAKRKVPHGFYGVMWNRAGTEVDPSRDDAQFALMAKSGVESVRTVFSWAGAQPVAGQAPSFTDTDHVVALAAAHRVTSCRWSSTRRSGRATIPDVASSGPKLPVRLLRLPHRPDRPLRPEGHLLGRAPRAAQGPGPALADLERAPLRGLLAHRGRRALGRPLHAAAEGRLPGRSSRPTPAPQVVTAALASFPWTLPQGRSTGPAAAK